MDRDQALKHLDEAITEAQRLIRVQRDQRKVDPWHRKTRIALEHIFGPESRQFKDFERISFIPLMWTASTPDAHFDESVVDGLRSAEGLLLALRDELTTFGRPQPKGAAPPSPAAAIDLDRITVPALYRGALRLSVKSWLLIAAIVGAIFGAGATMAHYGTKPGVRALEDSVASNKRALSAARAETVELQRRLRAADSLARFWKDSATKRGVTPKR
jgi:hypothetical protein